MEERHTEDHVDRLICRGRLISRANPHFSVDSLPSQPFLGDRNQMRGNVDADDPGSPLSERYNLFTRPATEVQDQLVSHVAKQIESVLQWKARVRGGDKYRVKSTSRILILLASEALRAISAKS